MKTFLILAVSSLALAGCAGHSIELGPIHVNCFLPQNLDHDQSTDPLSEEVIKDGSLPVVTSELSHERAKHKVHTDEYNQMRAFVKDHCG